MPASTRPAPGESSRFWAWIGAASALGLFLLSHPYWGIVHDAELYVGRAVADGDPAGLGRDIFFALEGQSAFSVYPLVAGAFLRWAGPGLGAVVLTLVGLFAWLAALAFFASSLARGRLLWAAVVVAATVPSFYGQAFRYAEQFATPRLPAEAMVLAGLGALAFGRQWLALAALCLAAVVHPLMAAPGLAVWLCVLARRDWRWLLLPLGGGALFVAAGLAGLPFADRLFRLVDPAWAEALSVNAYLFPSEWPGPAWALVGVQAATILLARPFIASADARRICSAILLVAALALALTAIAADHWLVVLVVQCQPWRAIWLLGVAAALAFPLAAVGLWRSGKGGQVALACLVLGWLVAPVSAIGAVPALGALALVARIRRRPDLVTVRVRNVAWIVVAAFAALILLQRAWLVAGIVAAKPADASILGHIWLFWAPTIVVALAAVVIALRTDVSLRPAFGVAAAATVLLLAAACWDDRSAFTRIADDHRSDPELARILPPGRGEILWLRNGAGFAWRLAGRPNWVSYMQGAAIVFSPELGAVWRDRMARLVAAGLADDADRYPWKGYAGSVLTPTKDSLEAFCAAPDAPVAIIVPLDDGLVRLPEGLPTSIYRLPAPSFDLSGRSGRLAWHRTDRQAVVTCSPRHQTDAPQGTHAG